MASGSPPRDSRYPEADGEVQTGLSGTGRSAPGARPIAPGSIKNPRPVPRGTDLVLAPTLVAQSPWTCPPGFAIRGHGRAAPGRNRTTPPERSATIAGELALQCA